MTPHVIGFGFKARSGKDACVLHLMKLYSNCNILHTSFARALRYEVHDMMFDVMAKHQCNPQEALKAMCEQHGVPFDPFADRDGADPYGKQRELLQAWGQKRRAEQRDYWIRKVVAEIERKQPSLVLISDCRHVNECDWVKAQGGATVRVDRSGPSQLKGQAVSHASERSLIDYKFDFTIKNDGSLHTLHNRAAELYRTILQLPLFT